MASMDGTNSTEMSSEHSEWHCSGSHRKLNEFRHDGKYCDIVIRVQKTTVKCHRAVLASVSKFFDIMFSSTFKENSTEEIVLPEVDPEAFESVLKFAYLGTKPDFSQPSNNAYNVLKTSDFLGVADLVKLCINRLITHTSSIVNVCEVFVFACVSNHPTLRDSLRAYICDNFLTVFQSEEFLTLPYEQLDMLLKEYYRRINDKSSCPSISLRNTWMKFELSLNVSSAANPLALQLIHSDSVFQYEDLLLDSIIRWTLHLQQRRRSNSLELLSYISFDKIPKNYCDFLSKEYSLNFHGYDDLKTCLSTFLLSKAGDALPAVAFNDPSKNLALHVYVEDQTRNRNRPTATKVFSISKHKSKWSSAHLKEHSYSFHYLMEGEIIGLDEPCNRLYCFSSCGLNLHTQQEERPLFLSCSSIMWDETKALTIPPYYSFDKLPKMCGFQNNSIYLYYKNDPETNILNYKCETDEWSSIPEMKTRMTEACMVSDDKLVYLIGGMDRNEQLCSGYVQAYDYRIPRWLEFTKPDADIRYYGTVCSYLKGKIYVSNNTNLIDVFDPVAGKWRELGFYSFPNPQFKIEKMVPFENNLWFFSENPEATFIFDPTVNHVLWYKSLHNLIESEINARYYDQFQRNAVVFRPH